MLKISNLSFSFGDHQVLRDFSLSLEKGQIGTLIGSSGSGKTTLFKLITGILALQSGTVLPYTSDQVAYMMQDDLLLPWRTVLNNLLLVGELGKYPRSYRDLLKQNARNYLDEMGLHDWIDAFPHQLSGGMRQRVSLARVLLQKRPILLLDEPFAALDVALREQLHKLLHQIRDQHNTTMLMVTHDFRDALSLSDRIFLLDDGYIVKEWTITSEIRQNPVAFHRVHDEMYHAIQHKVP